MQIKMNKNSVVASFSVTGIESFKDHNLKMQFLPFHSGGNQTLIRLTGLVNHENSELRPGSRHKG